MDYDFSEFKIDKADELRGRITCIYNRRTGVKYALKVKFNAH